MANTYVIYPDQTGDTTDYSLSFNYLSRNFVKATVDGVEAPFTFLSSHMIRFDEAPVGELKIYRETDATELINTYSDGSILIDDDLNESYYQTLHVSEEIDNRLSAEVERAPKLPAGSVPRDVQIIEGPAGRVLAWGPDGNIIHAPNSAAEAEVSAIEAEVSANDAEVARLLTLTYRDEVAEDKILTYDAVSTAVAAKNSAVDAAVEAQQYADHFLVASQGTVIQLTYVGGLMDVTGSFEGQAGRVVGPDAGVHTDPVVGGVVPNKGEYIWSSSPAGWRRIGDVPVRGELSALNEVPPSKLPFRDWSNIYPDPSMLDASLYSGGSFTLGIPSVGAVPATRISENVLLTTSSAGQVSVSTPSFPVEPSSPYVLEAKLGRNTGVGAAVTELRVHWYSDFSASDMIGYNTIGGAVSATAPTKRRATVVAPSDAVRARLVAVKSEGTNAHQIALFDIIVRRAIDAALLAPSHPYQDPSVSAESVLCLHVPQPGQEPLVLYKKNEGNGHLPASLTKMVTCLTALSIARRLDLTLTYPMTVQPMDATTGSGNNLLAGDVITLEGALANLLLPSSNVTATLVSRVFGQLLLDQYGGTETATDRFINEMNSIAVTVGATNSNFLTPHGLHAVGQTSTAHDMGLILLECLKYPEITDLWGRASYDLALTGPNARVVTIASSVTMVSDADVLGGKTGTLTPYDYHVGLHASAPSGNTLVVIVMRSPSSSQRFVDARNTIDAVVGGFDWPITTPTKRT